MVALRGLVCGIVLIVCTLCGEVLAMESRWSDVLETFGGVYVDERRDAEDLLGEIHLKPRLSLIADDKFLAFLSLDIRQDTAGDTHGLVNPIPDREARRAMLEAREAYVEYAPPGVLLRLGIQQFDWAVTDTVSPADNLSPRDWTDIVRWERLGQPALSLRVGSVSFAEAVLIPFFTSSRLATSDSRWVRPLPPGLEYGEIDAPEGSLQFAVRAGRTIDGVDVGASYFHGYSYSPFWKAEATTTAVILHPVYLQENVYALSVAREVAGFNGRLEIGLFDQKQADDFCQFVLGIDHEFSNIFRPTDSLYWLVQYVDEYVLERASSTTMRTFDLRRIFTQALMAKLRYDFDDHREWSLKLEGSYALDRADRYFQPAVVWNNGQLEVELGGDLFSGDADSFWGAYGANDRLYLKAIWKY